MDPNLPITEIALQSGFASISTFNRVFKKFKECTPTEFKDFYKAKSNSFYPGARSIDLNTNYFEAKDYLDVLKFFMFTL